MEYATISNLVDTGLVIALAVIVWAAYRQLRARQIKTEERTKFQSTVHPV